MVLAGISGRCGPTPELIAGGFVTLPISAERGGSALPWFGFLASLSFRTSLRPAHRLNVSDSLAPRIGEGSLKISGSILSGTGGVPGRTASPDCCCTAAEYL